MTEPTLIDSVPPEVDPTTGELYAPADVDPTLPDNVHALKQRIAALEEARRAVANDLQYAERDLRNARRSIKALQDELVEQRNEAPEAQTVKAIYRRWVEKTGRPPKRTKLGEKRAKAVLARIRAGHDAERIMRAVDGAAIAATTSSPETQRLALLAVMRRAVDLVAPAEADELRDLYREQMANVVVYDDLELICRNEVNVEKFAAIADRVAPLPEAAEVV